MGGDVEGGTGSGVFGPVIRAAFLPSYVSWSYCAGKQDGRTPATDNSWHFRDTERAMLSVLKAEGS